MAKNTLDMQQGYHRHLEKLMQKAVTVGPSSKLHCLLTETQASYRPCATSADGLLLHESSVCHLTCRASLLRQRKSMQTAAKFVFRQRMYTAHPAIASAACWPPRQVPCYSPDWVAQSMEADFSTRTDPTIAKNSSKPKAAFYFIDDDHKDSKNSVDLNREELDVGGKVKHKPYSNSRLLTQEEQRVLSSAANALQVVVQFEKIGPMSGCTWTSMVLSCSF